MSFDVQTYSPSEVVFTLAGTTISGWDRITIKRSAPSFKMVRGIRNRHTRVRNKDTSATIEIELLGTSSSNDLLTAIVEKDEKFGTGRIELMIKDTLGTFNFNSIEGYITGYADMSFGGDVGTRTWVIECLTSSYSRGEGWGVASLFKSASNAVSGLF